MYASEQGYNPLRGEYPTALKLKGRLMKIINLVLLLFLLAGGASAQAVSTPSDAPGVAVIEKNWRREMRNPALEEDPLRPNREQAEMERAMKQNQRDNALRNNIGLPPLPPPPRVPSSRSDDTPSLTIEYVYRAKISNTGTKAIRKLVWEYVFFDPSTQREVGRRRNESKVNISPGKTSNVVVRSASPPAGTVNVAQTGKKSQEQYSEQVVIQRIEYADGSVWRRDSN
jgi:hypothetical protein